MTACCTLTCMDMWIITDMDMRIKTNMDMWIITDMDV